MSSANDQELRHDRFFMRLAIQEAVKGQGRTSPNPCVGAVVVAGDVVVGRGYHKKAGTPHAEVHALNDAGSRARGATLYVTLEPCNHTGRTPPCSHAILKAGIRRVVIGMSDPNPVASGGAAFLRQQGLMVTTGICEEECRRINYPFIKYIRTGMPWVIMKAGASLDGRISYRSGSGGRITGRSSLARVHSLRNRTDAILIGRGTLLSDDPSLTCRLDNGETGRDPVRIILDSQLAIPDDAKILHLSSEAPTWIFCSQQAETGRERHLVETTGARIFRVGQNRDGNLDLRKILKTLAEMHLLSILVEGGARIHGSFLAQGLVDEVYLFQAPFFIGDQGTPVVQGTICQDPANAVHLRQIMLTRLDGDLLLQGLMPAAEKLVAAPS